MALTTAGYVKSANARVKAHMLRQTLWAATSGAEGVMAPTDLKVTADGSASVTVAAGAAIAPTRFVGAYPCQSYQAYNDGAVQVFIGPNTTGALRKIAVYMHWWDPEYGGSDTAPFVGISAGPVLPTDRPRVYLARINQPAGATGVTPAMLTGGGIFDSSGGGADTRVVATPRVYRRTVFSYPTAAKAFPKGSYSVLGGGFVKMDVPDWATWGKVMTTVTGLTYSGSDIGSAALLGKLAGDLDNQITVIGAEGKNTIGVTILSDFRVNAGNRGPDQLFEISGYQYAASSGKNAGTWSINDFSTLAFDYQFEERAE